MTKTTFIRKFETTKLVDFFLKLIAENNHEVIPYDTLNNLTGVDVRHTGCLDSARRIVLNEQNKNIVRVGTGIRLATVHDDEELAPTGTSRIRGIAKRTLKRMGAAKYDHMSDEGKRQHNLGAATLHVFVEFTKPTTQKAIGDKCQQSIPQIGDTLKMFESR